MNYVKETIFIIALAAVAVSCAKDSTPVNDPAGEKVFTAGISTKTELVGGNAVHWVANDKISLFDGVANREFETADAGTTASFSGTASDRSHIPCCWKSRGSQLRFLWGFPGFPSGRKRCADPALLFSRIPWQGLLQTVRYRTAYQSVVIVAEARLIRKMIQKTPAAVGRGLRI